MTRPLLVIRPEPEAQATAERARAAGLRPVVVPLFVVRAIPWTLPSGPFDAVLATSANAIRLGGDELNALISLPLYAVGSATAKAAEEAGFSGLRIGTAGVVDMLTMLASDLRTRVLHISGTDVTDHAPPPFALERVAVYSVDPVADPALPSDAVVLVHSARAGKRLAAVAKAKGAFDVVAISAKAGAAAGTGWRTVCWADAPTDSAMLALAAPMCER